MKKLSLVALGAAALFPAATPALADSYAFGFSDYSDQQNLVIGGSSISTSGFQGWVSDNGDNIGGPNGNTNYVLGNFADTDVINARDYLVFDISDLTSPVSSASLSLNTYAISGPISIRFGGASDLTPLLSNPTSPDPTLYTALGSGTEYGTYDLTDADSNTIYSFALNDAGLSDLNARIAAGDQYFAVAGSLASSGAVPEPASWAMMISGIGIAGGALRRRRANVRTIVRFA